MTVSSCPRQWQVEAIRDGRLLGPERVDFEGHQARCRECRELAERVEACAQKLKELPSGLPDAFTVRRQRQTLLQQVDASLTAPHSRRPRAAILLAAAVAAAACIALLGLWQRSVSRAAPWVEVAAAPGTWTETQSGKVDRVTLHEGHFGLAIHRPSADCRVVLALPDGEVEDLGTVLEIWVENGHTRRVAVQKGAVILRLHGASAINLQAGQEWSRQAPVAPTPAALTPATPNSTEPAAPLGAASAPSRLPASKLRPLFASARRTASARPAVPAEPPPNAADEDAAYVRVLNLLEANQRDEAKSAAERYLATYAHGFRRLEVLDIEQRLTRPRTDSSRSE